MDMNFSRSFFLIWNEKNNNLEDSRTATIEIIIINVYSTGRRKSETKNFLCQWIEDHYLKNKRPTERDDHTHRSKEIKKTSFYLSMFLHRINDKRQKIEFILTNHCLFKRKEEKKTPSLAHPEDHNWHLLIEYLAKEFSLFALDRIGWKETRRKISLLNLENWFSKEVI